MKQDIEKNPDEAPRKIYKKYLDESDNEPRDSKQIRNLKYRMKVADTIDKRLGSNIADEVLEVIQMKDSHPFVQSIGHLKDQVPTVICYTADQMKDFKQFIKSGVGRLGIDRTFNLGKSSKINLNSTGCGV